MLQGGAATWRAIESPNRVKHPDGRSEWLYELRVVNPGRLPIDDIQVHWMFPCDVVRVRHDGVTDLADRELVLGAPVLVGGAERIWKRRLLIDFADKAKLMDVYAEVDFNDMDGARHTNRWPRKPRQAWATRAKPAVAGEGRPGPVIAGS